MIKLFTHRYSVIGSLALLLLFITSCGSTNEETPATTEAAAVNQSPTPAAPPAFRTITVDPSSSKSSVYLTGRVEPIEEVSIAAEVNGRTVPTKKVFNEGVYYRQGELMVAIDREQLGYDLAAQKSQFKASIVRLLSVLKLDYGTAYKTWNAYLQQLNPKEQITDLPAIEDPQLENYLSSNGVFSSFYAIKSVEERYAKYRVYAPFSGVLTQASFSAGTVVAPGAPLGRFSRTDAYEFRGSVSAGAIDRLKVGQKITLTSTSNGATFSGSINRIGRTIDPTTQAIPVFVRLSGKGLRTGLFLETNIEGDQHTDVVELPTQTLTRNGEVHIIKDGTVLLKAVEVVSYLQDKVLVRGLGKGDQVITETIISPIVGKKATAL